MGSTPIERAFERDEFYQSEHPTKAELEAEVGDPQGPAGRGTADVLLTIERSTLFGNGGVRGDPAQDCGAAGDSPIGILFADPGVSSVAVTRISGDTVIYRRRELGDPIDGTFRRRARKRHTCATCKRAIEPGTFYLEYVGEVGAYQSGTRYHEAAACSAGIRI